MQAGIEIRHPYTDVRLIDFLFTCLPSLQFHPAYSKWLLRQAMQGVLPDELRLRRGKGRIARLLFEGVARAAEDLRILIQQMPPIAREVLDQPRLLQALELARLGADFFQPAFFGTVAFLLWVHRLPWSGGLLPTSEPPLVCQPVRTASEEVENHQ